MAVVVGGGAALAGLTLLVSISRVAGAILFAFGVGLICGVAVGFVIGPDIVEQLPTVALGGGS